MAAPLTEVWCILVNHNFEPIGGALNVQVPSNGFILDLVDKVRDRAQLVLAAHLLVVWRLCNPRGSREIMRSLPNLKRLGDALVEGEGQDEAAWLVPAEEDILMHFSGLQRGKISALVWVPPPSQIGGSSDRECSIHILTQLIVSEVHVIIHISWTEPAPGGRSGPGHEIHSRHSIRSAGTV
jgi:hypothetical protein